MPKYFSEPAGSVWRNGPNGTRIMSFRDGGGLVNHFTFKETVGGGVVTEALIKRGLPSGSGIEGGKAGRLHDGHVHWVKSHNRTGKPGFRDDIYGTAKRLKLAGDENLGHGPRDMRGFERIVAGPAIDSAARVSQAASSLANTTTVEGLRSGTESLATATRGLVETTGKLTNKAIEIQARATSRLARGLAATAVRLARTAEGLAINARNLAERASTLARVAAEKTADAARLAAEKASDALRKAAEKTAAAARVAAEKAAVAARVAAEKAAIATRVAAEATAKAAAAVAATAAAAVGLGG